MPRSGGRCTCDFVWPQGGHLRGLWQLATQDELWPPRQQPVDKGDAEAEARRNFERMYEDGCVEPHPGPALTVDRPHTVRTVDVLGKIGCPYNHKSENTKAAPGGGSGRRAYVCGRCGIKFVQNDPTAKDFEYKHRRPVTQAGEVKRRLQRDMHNLVPPEPRTSTRDVHTPCMGDVRVRWHNGGGLADGERRRKYLRRLMHNVDIAGICETSWDDGMAEGTKKLAKLDAQIRSDVYTGGQHRRESGSYRNAGMALIVREGVATDVCVRELRDVSLQCLVADLTIRGLKLRVVLSHGDPSSDPRLKGAYYRRVIRAVEAVNEADETAGEGVRPAIWMGDHNMVMDRDLDEERGTNYGRLAHEELVALVHSTEGVIAGREGMADAFRVSNKPGTRGYTRGVRRLDWAVASTQLLRRDVLPRIEGVVHTSQEQLEVAVRTPEGWALKTPDHKAVDVTLRFSEEKKEGGQGWSVKTKGYYPQCTNTSMGTMKRLITVHDCATKPGLRKCPRADMRGRIGPRARLNIASAVVS